MANIDVAIHEARATLADRQRDLVSLAAAGTALEDPKWVEADAAVEKASANIRRLELMRQAGKIHESEAALAALKSRRLTAYGKAIELAKGRVALAGKIDSTIATLGKLLEQWAEIGRECRSNTAMVHGTDAQPAWQYTMLDAASGNNARFAVAFEWQLLIGKVGLAGITADFTPRRPIGDSYTIKEAAEYTVEQLERQLENALRMLKED